MQGAIARIKKHIGVYEVIAFIIGYALLTYELIASRLLAPTIGASTYVWTSVIGVIIAALAFGYTYGGWLADKRAKQVDIAALLLLSAAAICLTLIFYRDVLLLVSQLVRDSRMAGVVASVILFLPASFILGAISPYLARMRNVSLATTGQSIAGLSASNSIGGITGTFTAGFILFSLIGSRQTLAILVILLVVTSWLLVPKQKTSFRFSSSLIIAVLAVAGLLVPQSNALAEIDTPSAHYEVIQTNYQGQPITALTAGPGGLQSGVYTDGSKALVFSYTQKLADVVAAKPDKTDILVIGGGTFTLPEYLGNQYPDSTIDAVEIDPRLEGIAEQYFQFSTPPNVRIITADGRAYLQQTSKQYDLIIVDAYDDDEVPFSLATAEFARLTQLSLKKHGVVLANLIASDGADCGPLLDNFHAAYTSALPHFAYYPLRDETFDQRQNIIALYSRSATPWNESVVGKFDPDLTKVSPPTDNFSKIESLSQACSVR